MAEGYDRHRRLRLDVGNAELKDQAVAVGLVQLCAELVDAGALSEAALYRIKQSIANYVALSPPRGTTCQQHRDDVMVKLNKVLATHDEAADQGRTDL